MKSLFSLSRKITVNFDDTQNPREKKEMNCFHTSFLNPAAVALFNFILLYSSIAMAYVMSADQILELSHAEFSHFETLVITQSARYKAIQGINNETTSEKIWINASGEYDLESNVIQTEPEQNTDPLETVFSAHDMSYRPLLMAAGLTRKKKLLSDMGIDLDDVSFTRFEGSIVYRIGNKNPSAPKLIIEKATFLPLFLSYHVDINSEIKTVKVRFENYQEINRGWYPFEILYTMDETTTVQYIVQEIEVNTPINRLLKEITTQFAPEELIPDELPAAQKDQRLKEIIELLKEKY